MLFESRWRAKMDGKLVQNWCQNGPGNAWSRASKRKLRKCVFEQQYIVFAWFSMSGGWKIEEKIKPIFNYNTEEREIDIDAILELDED